MNAGGNFNANAQGGAIHSSGTLIILNSTFSGNAALVTGVPRPLFPVAGYRGARNRQEYDVAPDDQRFLMIQLGPSGAPAGVIHVENWFAELRIRMEGK